MLNQRWQHISKYKLTQENESDALDHLIASLADFFEFPVALISVLGQKQWLIAKAGLDVDFTSLEDAFCRHVVERRAPLVIEDASQHPDFCDNPSCSPARIFAFMQVCHWWRGAGGRRRVPDR